MKTRTCLAARCGSAMLVGLILMGCGGHNFVDYAELRPLASEEDAFFRLPVVFIPGIKGTHLVGREGRDMWGLSGNVALFSGFSDLTLDYEHIADGNMEKFADYYRYKGTYPGRVLMKYRIGWKWLNFHDYDVYDQIIKLLVQEGEYTSEGDLFLLAYDWRLDNRIAAVSLALMLDLVRSEHARLMQEKYCTAANKRRKTTTRCDSPEMREAYTRKLESLKKAHPHLFTERAGQPEARIHVVAHSMGGLVGQYFITRLGGWEDVSHFITLGTPSKGGMDMLKAFVEGEYPDTLWSSLTGFLLFEKRATNFITMSFPSVFQLLPRYPGAVEQGDLDDFGLAAAPAALSPEKLNAVFEVYRKYGVLPDLLAASRALNRQLALDEDIIRRHFQTQLLGTACPTSVLAALTRPPMLPEPGRTVRPAARAASALPRCTVARGRLSSSAPPRRPGQSIWLTSSSRLR